MEDAAKYIEEAVAGTIDTDEGVGEEVKDDAPPLGPADDGDASGDDVSHADDLTFSVHDDGRQSNPFVMSGWRTPVLHTTRQNTSAMEIRPEQPSCRSDGQLMRIAASDADAERRAYNLARIKAWRQRNRAAWLASQRNYYVTHAEERRGKARTRYHQLKQQVQVQTS